MRKISNLVLKKEKVKDRYRQFIEKWHIRWSTSYWSTVFSCIRFEVIKTPNNIVVYGRVIGKQSITDGWWNTHYYLHGDQFASVFQNHKYFYNLIRKFCFWEFTLQNVPVNVNLIYWQDIYYNIIYNRKYLEIIRDLLNKLYVHQWKRYISCQNKWANSFSTDEISKQNKICYIHIGKREKL